METKKTKAVAVVVETTAADVAVYGAKLIGKKALSNMAIILNALENHGVRSVTFSTEVPRGMVADCHIDSGSVTINMMETFGKSFETCLDKEKQGAISVSFLFWHNIYASIIHESLHLQSPEMPEKEIETDAIKMLFLIAKMYNIEPGKSPFVTEQMNELLSNDNDKFILVQKAMWEAGESFTNGKTRLTTYREFAHLFSGDKEDDPEWNQKPKNKFIPVRMPEETVPLPTAPDPFNSYQKYVPAVGSAPTPAPATFIAPTGNADLFFQPDYMKDTSEYTGDFDIDGMEVGETDEGIADDDEFGMAFMEMQFNAMSGGQPMQPINIPPAQDVLPQQQFITATPEQLEQIKAFILDGNVYLPHEHSMIGTPQQLLTLTNELLGDNTPAQAPATVGLIPNNQEQIIRTLPKTGLTPERTGEIMRGVYTKCFNQIFGDCGQQLSSDTAFICPEAVLRPIALTPEEQSVITGFNCHINGKWCRSEVINGNICGFVGGIKHLPTYKLFINMDGIEVCRLVLPQNPAKMHGANLSPKAALARKGVAIVYIMEGDDAAKNAGAKQWLYKAVIERTDLNIPAVATAASWQEC